jgi:hypothetical protein
MVPAMLVAACLAIGLTTGARKCGAADAKGDIVLAAAEQTNVWGNLFEPVSPEQKPWAEQYDSKYLVEKPIPGIVRGSEVVVLAQDSCAGRSEYVFYPDGTVTVYSRLIGGPKGETFDYSTVKMTPAAVAKLQSDLAAAKFFELSSNLINLKRFLADRRPGAATAKLEEDGVTVSMKVVHPISKLSAAFHIYQFADVKKAYPMLKEYTVFETCVQLVLGGIPAEKRLKLSNDGSR